MASPTIADGAVATSISAATATWLAGLDPILHFTATLVAIIAGVYSIAWHRKRLKASDEKKSKKKS